MAPDPGQPRRDRPAHAIGLARGRRDQSVGDRPGPPRHGEPERDPREDAPCGEPSGRTHRSGVLLPRHGRIAITLPQAQPGDVLRHRGAIQRCPRSRAVRGGQPARPAGRGGRRRTAGPGAHGQGKEDARRGQLARGDDGLFRSRRGGPGVVSMTFLRSLAFALAQIVVTPPYAIVALATFPLQRLTRYRVISGWSHVMIWLAKKILGIEYRVIG